MVVKAEQLTKGSVRRKAPGQFGSKLIWVESVPERLNRYTLMAVEVDEVHQGSSAAFDLLDGHDFNVASRVHEYGGRAWWPGETHMFFSSADTGCVYAFDGKEDPFQCVEFALDTRWADGCSDRKGGFVAVREIHASSEEVLNELVWVDCEANVSVLSSTADFYSDPRVNESGDLISWVEWDHPNMPWDHTTVMVGSLGADGISNLHSVSNGATAALNPKWITDRRLGFVDDVSGFWHLYSVTVDTETGEPSLPNQLTPDQDGEINRVAWFMGDERWLTLPDGTIVVAWTSNASDTLLALDPAGAIQAIDSDLDEIFEVGTAIGEHPMVVTIGSARHASAVVEVHIFDGSGPATAITIADPNLSFQPHQISQAESHIATSLMDLQSNEGRSNMDPGIQLFYYPATTDILTSSSGPPLVVMCHGGPTGYTTAALNLKVQYWTTRGFAVADVNYRGSTGFGRDYRQSLNGKWGVADVQDLEASATYLIDKGLVDPDRVAVRGGSSGGLTVMLALRDSDLFCCGTSVYGVSGMKTLSDITHKFESHYIETLVGSYPESADIYEQRSPIAAPELIRKPLLLLHGTMDPIVPISESQQIHDALKAHGIPTELVAMHGEGHGFRTPENIVKAFEFELWFYGKVMGFVPEFDALFAEELRGKSLG